MDNDIIVRDDLANLMTQCQDDDKALWCVLEHQGNYEFERPAVMVFNCGHEANRKLTPEYVNTAKKLHYFDWLGGGESKLIGGLYKGWNFLEHYEEPPLNRREVKLVHYTQGVPNWPETAEGPFSDDFQRYKRAAVSALPWETLMGNSVHAKHVMERLNATPNDQREISSTEPESPGGN